MSNLNTPIKSTAFKLTTPTQPGGSKRKRPPSAQKPQPRGMWENSLRLTLLVSLGNTTPNKRSRGSAPRILSDSDDEVEISTESRLSQLIGRPRETHKDPGQELEEIDLSDSPPKARRTPKASKLVPKGKHVLPEKPDSLPDDEIEVREPLQF